MTSWLKNYIRNNHLGLIAIFLALNGVAYAAVSKGTVDSESVRDRSLQGVDLQTGAIHARNINVRSVRSVLQARVKGVCKTGQAIRVITRKGSVSCTSTSVSASDLDLSNVSNVLQQRVKERCTDGQAIRGIAVDGGVSCIATADGGKITGVGTAGGLTGGGTSGNLSISTDPTLLQRRVNGTCTGNEALRAVGEDGTVGCNPFQVPLVGGGCAAPGEVVRQVNAVTGVVTCAPAVSSVTAGTGLSGGGGPGAVTLDADTTYLQRRIGTGCSGANAIQSVNADGTVACLTTGTGSVTSVGVAAGSGLTASPNPITTTGSIGTDFATIQKRVTGACAAAGATGIQSIAADGTVNCGNLQIRVSGACAGNEAIQSVNADGTVSCRSVVTSLAPVAGSGLTFTPNPITGTGTVGTDFSTIQKRVSGTCAAAGANAVQSINAEGNVVCGDLQQRVTGTCAGKSAVQSVTSAGAVNCSEEFTTADEIFTSGLREEAHGGPDVVLIDNGFFEVLGRCLPGEGVKIIAKANAGMNALVDSQVNGFHAVGTVAEDALSNLTTNGTDMAQFELGGTTGAAAGRTLSGGFYDFATPLGCQFTVSATAG